MPVALLTTDPTGWLEISISLLFGFLCLAKGADWLVAASSQLAHRIGISTLVIGLTVVAFGTSAPEIVVSMLAAGQGKVELSLGNVLGSNVANIGLVLGACAVVLPRVLESRLTRRDAFWLFASLGLFWFVVHDGAITRVDAAMMLAAFVAYNVHLLRTGKRELREAEEEHEGHYRHPGRYLVLGIVSIALGAELVVHGAEAGALRIGIPESVVGLTIVAIGTSLPELAAGLGGAFRGESDISLGNVVGSNVFNLLAVIGLVALFRPFVPSAPGDTLDVAFARVLDEDLFVVLGFSLAAVGLPWFGGSRGGRSKGFLLLAAYFAYTGWLYVSR